MANGWHAEIALRFAPRGERTVLAARRQSGPLTVQRPFYPEADGVCHTYLLHPPAGIVGGDDLRMSFELDSGAHALVTTPAATRWYFSRGAGARVHQRAALADGATLEWLPQETLLFDGAHAQLTTRVDLQRGARFCGWEILGLGRPACGERFLNGQLDFRFETFRDGAPLLLERLRGGAGGPAGLRGHDACATFVATPADASALERARQCLDIAPETLCAATLIGDVLVGRGLAAHCEPLVSAFRTLWSALRPLILGRVAEPPRIWHT
jgi:urease accessory protein